MLFHMRSIICYRGRQVTKEDVAFIRELIASYPEASRRALSKKLCEAWNWFQENGNMRDMVCRGLMLALHRQGHIELPPVKMIPPNPLSRKRRPAPVEIDRRPIRGTLASLGPLTFQQVRRTADEPLFNSLLEEHHYLGYTQPVGEQLKYLVYAASRPVACFAWSSAPRCLRPRDRYIGWSAEARCANIRFVAYNSRFLILPWLEIRHLASHVLGGMVRILSREWERLYNHPLYFAETFVDPRFKGTCYRAANWVFLGRTTGRGKDDRSHRANRPLKDMFGYALTERFRQLLTTVS